MKRDRASLRHPRSLEWLLPVATGVAFAACLLGGVSKAQPVSKESASSVIRHHDDDDRHDRSVRNRIPPKRRSGQEGSAEAKLDSEEARELYIRRKARLEQIQAQKEELSRDKVTLATSRARMRARRIETARAIRLSERRLTGIEARLHETRARVDEQRSRLKEKSEQMSTLFALMQSMSRQPPPLLITHTSDALKMIRSGMILGTFYGDIEKLALQLTDEIGTLEAAQKEAELQEHRHRTEQTQNARLKAQLDQLLKENRNNLEANADSLANIKSASRLNAAALKSLEEMLPVLDSTAAKKPDVSSKEAANTGPSGAKMALAQPGAIQAAISFANSQGLLPLPVQGKILIRFGQSDQDGAPSKGIHLETRESSQVISPCDGLIMYAGFFRSYGQLLIINPGGGYHIILAGMDRIDAQQGQYVLAGEPIAAMGTQTHTGDMLARRPTLYVEFRRDQQSIDPEPWWSSGGKG